jgi:hypothetical protein
MITILEKADGGQSCKGINASNVVNLLLDLMIPLIDLKP